MDSVVVEHFPYQIVGFKAALATDKRRLIDLSELYRNHVRVEDTDLSLLARRSLTAEQHAAIGQDMKAAARIFCNTRLTHPACPVMLEASRSESIP